MTWKLEASGTQCWFCDNVGIWFALSRDEVARKWKEVCSGKKTKRGKKVLLQEVDVLKTEMYLRTREREDDVLAEKGSW